MWVSPMAYLGGIQCNIIIYDYIVNIGIMIDTKHCSYILFISLTFLPIFKQILDCCRYKPLFQSWWEQETRKRIQERNLPLELQWI